MTYGYSIPYRCGIRPLELIFPFRFDIGPLEILFLLYLIIGLYRDDIYYSHDI